MGVGEDLGRCSDSGVARNSNFEGGERDGGIVWYLKHDVKA